MERKTRDFSYSSTPHALRYRSSSQTAQHRVDASRIPHRLRASCIEIAYPSAVWSEPVMESAREADKLTVRARSKKLTASDTGRPSAGK